MHFSERLDPLATCDANENERGCQSKCGYALHDYEMLRCARVTGNGPRALRRWLASSVALAVYTYTRGPSYAYWSLRADGDMDHGVIDITVPTPAKEGADEGHQDGHVTPLRRRAELAPVAQRRFMRLVVKLPNERGPLRATSAAGSEGRAYAAPPYTDFATTQRYVR
jgi:hypothetical protein